MSADALSSLLDPAIMFFLVGVFAGAVRSNLEIPPQVAKFLSLYLLVALGFKGGQQLGATGLGVEGIKVVGIALVLAALIPALSFLVLRRSVEAFDAAAIAATYGSVSAVTFIAATNFVADQGETANARDALSDGRAAVDASGSDPLSVRAVLHEAFTDGAHLLLIGSLVVGFVVGERGGEAMAPFTSGIFTGMLAFFLLEMGLLVTRQLRELRDVGPFLIGFGLLMPLGSAAIALTLGGLAGLSVGDLTVLTVLAASASYIVVPAVIRYAIPEARPSRYFTMALAVTFPFNIVIGIPLYFAVAQWIAG